MKSKTIIISSEETSGRGILTLYQEDDLLKCRLRLYNVEKLSRHCRLGIYHHEEVYSANLLEKNGVYESSMVGDFDIDQDFYSAIIDTQHENKVLLSGGTYAGYYFNDHSVFNFDEKQPTENVEKISTCDESNEKCQNCKYKEYFYSHTEPSSALMMTEKAQGDILHPCHSEQTECTEESHEKNTNSIIESIIPQFQYIFEHYAPDTTLNNLLPNSKFVQINENQDQYSIGAIYQEENIKYLCYAVKCDYNTPAPEELGEHYQWLPLDNEDPLSNGYYIVFQDASDLKILKL